MNFDGWLEHTEHRDPTTLNFWLAYWIAAYRHILEQHEERIILVAHNELCIDPRPNLANLAARLRLADPDSFVAGAERIKSVGERAVDLAGVETALVDRALRLFAELGAKALHP